MKKIFDFFKTLFSRADNQKPVNLSNTSEPILKDTPTFTPNGQTDIHETKNNKADDIVTITSRNIGNNTTEMTIELNEEVLLKKLKDGTLGSGKREIDVEDITGFYGSKQYSPNRQYCVSYADGHYENDKWKNGDIALVKDKKLLFKKKLQRPNDCFVSNDGIVIAVLTPHNLERFFKTV